MADPTLTRGLRNLRQQVNDAFPYRDKTSDGWIGDAAHQATTSGHNPDDTDGSRPAWDGDSDNDPEVRAWDMDSDLGDPSVTAQDVVDHLRKLPGLSGVIRYMIYDRRMYHARDGFDPTPYTGSSPHTEHIHFEGAWSQSGDNNTTYDFRLGDLVALTKDEFLSLLRDGDVREALCRAVNYTDGVLPAPAGAAPNPDGTANSEWTAWGFLTNIYSAAVSARTYAAATRDALGAINAQDIAAAVAAAIAALPSGPDISQDQLEAAFIGALKKMAAGQ